MGKKKRKLTIWGKLLVLVIIGASIFGLYKLEGILNSKEVESSEVKEKIETTSTEEDTIEEDTTITKEETKEEKKSTTKTTTYKGKFSNPNNLVINSEWESTIVSWLDAYMKAQKELTSVDVTNLFSNPSGGEAYLSQTALDFLVEHHKMQFNDMSLTSGSYDIEYLTKEESGNTVKITYNQSDTVKYKYLNGITSKVVDAYNEIVINTTTNKIESLYVEQAFFVMFSNLVDTSSSNVKSKLDSLKSDYTTKTTNLLSEYKTKKEYAYNNPYTAKITCSSTYDREAAANYSYKYVKDRNPEYYDFGLIGGNCQNMVSQSMHAGGINFDLTGSNHWKYYGSGLDNSSNKSGRTSSWTAVRNFYTYIINNASEGDGICAEADVNIFYAEAGDVIHVGYDGYSHATIAVKQVKDSDGKVTDILLNSNTTGLENYPLLAYTYPNKRVIKILGNK